MLMLSFESNEITRFFEWATRFQNQRLFHNVEMSGFSVTHIFREINFGAFKSSKSQPLNVLNPQIDFT